jgi:NTE family protein
VKYGRLEVKAGAAYTVRDLTFLAALEGGQATKGDLPLADAFALGGPRRLSSYATGQILGDEYTFGRLELQYRLTKPMPFLGFTVFAGLTAEAGRMNKLVTESSLSGWQTSFGAYLAANTPLGPFYFGYADGKNGKGRVYLFIGTP